MSRLRTLLRPRRVPTTSSIAACTLTTANRPNARRGEYRTGRCLDGDSIGGERGVAGRTTSKSVEDVFVRSMLIAGTCRACSTHTASKTATRKVSRSRDLNDDHTGSRRAPKSAFSTTSRCSPFPAALQSAEELEPETSQRQYEDLVDTANVSSLRTPKPKSRPEHLRLAPRLVMTPEQENRPPHKNRQILEPIDEEHRNKIRRLKKLLANGPGLHLNKTWQVYLDLPSPRLRYFSDRTTWKLLNHFAWVEVRDSASSQRYFSLLDEALRSGVSLRASSWNTAISFAGRWVMTTTAEEVKAAIDTWLRMERQGGVAADSVTFNILFDVAVKAERYALADTIHAEMDRRGLHLDRYFRTSKIYYAGKRGDADSVRAAFRELVAAGEIVDTAVMNCVVLSLVRAGEAPSAEHVVGKMKQLHEQKFGVASLQNWREKKAMGRQLGSSARQLRAAKDEHISSFFGSPYSNEDKREEIQRAAPIAPDEVTYRILIQWHANVTGNLDKIRSYIDEIKATGWKVRYFIYYALFAGFYKHGGYAFTAWNRKSLEEYWKDFVDSVVNDAAAAEMAVRLDARIDKLAAFERQDVCPLAPSDGLNALGTETNSEEDVGDIPGDADPLPSHIAPTEFRPGTVLAALAAFYKCAGPKRMLEVWDEVQAKWTDLGQADRRRMEELVARKVREAGVYVNA